MSMLLPDWIKIASYDKNAYQKTRDILINNGLTNVCLEANCPNRYECFARGTATFMILGNVCTRDCAYCNIKKGRPKRPDQTEPERIAAAVKMMGLKYAVITCVTRDDLADGGAGQFALTIKAIKKNNPGCRVEVLISDLEGNWPALKKIIKAGPDVINHNLETVKNIFDLVRPNGDYKRSLELLKKIKEFSADLETKSGFMVGLGETSVQIKKTLKDLKRSCCDIVTIGQYLQPSPVHFEVRKYYTPDEFKQIRASAKKIGIKKIFAGPLVRSSYKADEKI